MLFKGVCFHELSLSFFYYLYGFITLLLDIDVKSTTRFFYHYFRFTRGKNSIYLNINPLHLQKNNQKMGVADEDSHTILLFPSTKHNTSKYIFVDASFFPSSLRKAQRTKHESPTFRLIPEETEIVAKLEEMYPVAVSLTYAVQDLFDSDSYATYLSQNIHKGVWLNSTYPKGARPYNVPHERGDLRCRNVSWTIGWIL